MQRDPATGVPFEPPRPSCAVQVAVQVTETATGRELLRVSPPLYVRYPKTPPGGRQELVPVWDRVAAEVAESVAQGVGNPR